MLHKLQMQKFPNKKQTSFWHIEIFALPSFLKRSGGRGVKTNNKWKWTWFCKKSQNSVKKIEEKIVPLKNYNFLRIINLFYVNMVIFLKIKKFPILLQLF